MDATMLIVDDNEMNREVLKVLFADEFIILEAENGREAKVIAEGCRGSIDVILLDLVMPDISGFDLLEARKKNEFVKEVPVVVISASGNMEDQVRAFELGANDFIDKPFVPEIVISRVNNVIGSHQKMKRVAIEAEKLKVKAELDQMTGIYNKTTAEYTANEILKEAEGQLHALFVIDIDNFKSVNDTSGHLVGDHVIQIIADLISRNFRKTDVVGRIGGDEFVVLMTDISSMGIARQKANELVLLMKYKPNLTIPENVTLSIGIASNEGNPTHYSDLFIKADHALLQAKEDGRACYREDGIEVGSIQDDSKPAVLLISKNRSVCSTIQSIVPQDVKVVDVLNLRSIRDINEKTRGRIQVVYADVSDCDGAAVGFWNSLSKEKWIDCTSVIAICEEGNMNQYAEALKMQVADILTVPMDSNMAKRRTMRLLDKLGILENK